MSGWPASPRGRCLKMEPFPRLRPTLEGQQACLGEIPSPGLLGPNLGNQSCGMRFGLGQLRWRADARRRPGMTQRRPPATSWTDQSASYHAQALVRPWHAAHAASMPSPRSPPLSLSHLVFVLVSWRGWDPRCDMPPARTPRSLCASAQVPRPGHTGRTGRSSVLSLAAFQSDQRQVFSCGPTFAR